MPFATKQQIFDKARILLGDSEVLGGQVFTDDGANGTINLSILLATVHSEAYRHLEEFENPFTIRDFHASLSAYQAYLDPAAVGISNVGEIQQIRSRSIDRTLTISAVTPDLANAVCAIQTSAAHGLASGDNVVILGTIADVLNILGEWVVVVTGAATFNILGCRASGTWASGGSVVVPGGRWSELDAIDPPLDLENASQRSYLWAGDVLRFPPSSEERLVKVTYHISATLPASDTESLAPDDMSDYYSYRLASLGAESNGDYETADRMQLKAVGPNPDEPSGFLGQILDNGVKAMNTKVYQFGRFRQRRIHPAAMTR